MTLFRLNASTKKSGAELTEAFKSMYRFHRDAGICYAFLADVDVHDGASLAKSC